MGPARRERPAGADHAGPQVLQGPQEAREDGGDGDLPPRRARALRARSAPGDHAPQPGVVPEVAPPLNESAGPFKLQPRSARGEARGERARADNLPRTLE